MNYLRMFKVGFLLLAIIFGFSGDVSGALGQSSPPLSPRNANYQMDVRLDVQNKLIEGEEILTWINITEQAAPDLRFHLYYNAWSTDQTSFLKRMVTRRLKLNEYRDDEWAYSLVKKIQIVDKAGKVLADLTPQMEYIQPDDGNPYDRTVMRVPLEQPVQPSDTIRVKIVWESKIPRTFARTGYRGNYFFLAQWFPKIGVFQSDGTWNCHQFIQTEFFADYGVYDVRLQVPSGWVVGATGRELEVIDNKDGTSTHHFYQEDVHDFVWTTSPDYQVYEDRFEEPGLPPVDIRLLLMPDHLNKKDRYFEATKITLKYYGSWFGAYPYGHITVVDPAFGSGAGGMEYPTLFTGGTRWISPPETRSPESVTIHEAGHQFWYGIIGNNEFEDAWLDEGFNTYSQSRVMKEVGMDRILYRRYFKGYIPVIFPDVKMTSRIDGADQYDGFRNALKLDPLAVPSYKDGPGSYRVNAYNKPALMLRTLENYLGWETFQKILSTYFERWKFKHPKPQDFFDVVEEVSGQDMDWFFNEAYRTANVFDYAVGKVSTKPVRPPKGYFQEGDSMVFRKPELQKEEEAAEEKEFQSIVYVRRWGEAVFPIEIKMIFDDGEEIMEYWDGKTRWIRFEYTRPAKLAQVLVDPEHKLALDINYTNNTWIREAPTKLATYKWVTKWMLWVQNLMEFFAFWG